MQKRNEEYENNLLLRGLVDTRKLTGLFTAKRLPHGEFGLCILCLKDNMLNVYDTGFKQDIGDLLYSVDLKNVSNIKTSTFALNSYLKFTYEGFDYKFTNCSFKPLYEAIESEVYNK